MVAPIASKAAMNSRLFCRKNVSKKLSPTAPSTAPGSIEMKMSHASRRSGSWPIDRSLMEASQATSNRTRSVQK